MDVFAFRDELVTEYESSPGASPASGQRTSRGRWTRPTPPADSGPEPLIQLNPSFEPGGWPHTSKVGAAPGAQREITVPYTVRSLSAKSSPATQFYAGYPDTREDNNPRIHFPDGFDRDGCKVDVWVSKWSDHSRAGWDLAHECVHLLDPIMEKYATYLEEGLATWYQDSPQLPSRLPEHPQPGSGAYQRTPRRNAT